MATKLGLFNASLIEFGDRKLSDTGDTVEAARVLVQVYDNVVQECLEAASWNFAMEDVEITGDTGLITARVGYRFGFTKPSDWLSTVAVSLDEFFTFPLIHYYDDDEKFKADSTPLFLRYVSNDTGKGLDLSCWPQRFTRYVELELAHRVVKRLGGSKEDKIMIDKDRDTARKSAKNQDAMNEAQPKFAPHGSWTLSRGGRVGRDRGSRSNLTG